MSSHLIRGRQLSRDTEHRKALRRNLCQSLFEHGKIRTTLPKAKEVKAFAEKLITLARQPTVHHRRLALADLPNKDAVEKLFKEIGPRYVNRPGGYTRITKTGVRKGDGAPMAQIELVR